MTLRREDWYELFVPSQGPPRALLLMLHGCTQNSADFARGTRMNEWGERGGFAVLYPEQSAEANSRLCWNWFMKAHQQAGSGEPGLLLDRTRQAMAELAIAPGRVYVAGLSAGACMAAILAARYPDFFAGVGLHSGVPLGAAASTLGALLAMRGLSRWGKDQGWSSPTLIFHGDKDNVVSVKNAERLCRQACQTDLTTREETLQEGGRRVRRGQFLNDQGRVQVESWVVEGLGHAWSGGSPEGAWTDPEGPDASAHLVRFFGLVGDKLE
ncbi:MAG: PHB depolymerase family esterase [Candidatus Eremiobacteraeota bacterium]|nr:PHB depolymerase family esterase [Candidatus Eremiobacteraeota bacterium]MCW5867332.1 PHB depolymerase family esterase [Candidatus Eremiobacteraeota bacterium]